MDKQQIAKELLARRKARASIKDFWAYCQKDFVDGKHIKIITDALQKVSDGKCKRLIISCCPRHGKSEAVINACLYHMSNNPKSKIVYTSYADGLALEQSRRMKLILDSDKYKNLYPEQTFKGTKSTEKLWTLPNGSQGFFTGIGGSLTGRGMDIGIIDDYIKDRQEATSEVTLSRIEDWYKSTFYTRREPNSAVIIIATRWSPDDLIGSLLKNEQEKWEVIELPAINEDKEALWPERFPIEDLNDIKESIGTYEWEALYQCQPTVRSGNLFKVDNVKIHDSTEEFPHTRHIRCWDLASSIKERAKSDPDYTVGVYGTATKDAKGLWHLWIADVTYGQWEAPERNKIIQRCCRKDGMGTSVFVESFGGYKDAYTTLKDILMGVGVVYKSQLPGDKVVKASKMEPVFESGNVHLLKAPWNEIFLKQFREFPMGRHDDVVDATAILFNELTKGQSTIYVRR